MRLDADRAWLEGIRRSSSPNCDDRPRDCEPSLLVVHGISVPAGQFGGGGIDELFTNRLDPAAHEEYAELAALEVSAHALITRQGEVTQYVPFTRRAWHAGESCYGGRRRCNDFSIGVELEGTDEIPYEEVQYDLLAELARLLMATWPGLTADRIVGHCDIAPGRKTDPGSAFDWYRLRRLVGGSG